MNAVTYSADSEQRTQAADFLRYIVCMLGDACKRENKMMHDDLAYIMGYKSRDIISVMRNWDPAGREPLYPKSALLAYLYAVGIKDVGYMFRVGALHDCISGRTPIEPQELNLDTYEWHDVSGERHTEEVCVHHEARKTFAPILDRA